MLPQNMIILHPNLTPTGIRYACKVSLTPFLDQSEPEFSRRRAHGGLVADIIHRRLVRRMYWHWRQYLRRRMCLMTDASNDVLVMPVSGQRCRHGGIRCGRRTLAHMRGHQFPTTMVVAMLDRLLDGRGAILRSS